MAGDGSDLILWKDNGRKVILWLRGIFVEKMMKLVALQVIQGDGGAKAGVEGEGGGSGDTGSPKPMSNIRSASSNTR